jgi:hypothetical protein
MPAADTFSIPPIAKLLARYIRPGDLVCDPFARNSTLAQLSNDLNPDTVAEHHMPAEEFLVMLHGEHEGRVDVLLFDPPYSPRQISECYQGIGLAVAMQDTQTARLYAAARDAGNPLVRRGGVAISFGWNSTGMGKGRGYQMEELLLVAHGGAHNDTIVVVERKVAFL